MYTIAAFQFHTKPVSCRQRLLSKQLEQPTHRTLLRAFRSFLAVPNRVETVACLVRAFHGGVTFV